MIEVIVPGHRDFRFEHLVLDYNGTLACDGELIDGVATRLNALSQQLQVHVVTADTFGKARDALRNVTCIATIVQPADQAEAKRRYVEKLVPSHAIAVGNGRNDALMLQAATLGIAIVGPEGTAVDTLTAAQIVMPDILAALDVLRHPLRLVATLRS